MFRDEIKKLGDILGNMQQEVAEIDTIISAMEKQKNSECPILKNHPLDEIFKKGEK